MKMIELEPQPHAITSSVLLADTLLWNGGFGASVQICQKQDHHQRKRHDVLP
ncbi:hypothetical protein sync_2079 [Synechococcus sp. CC9311]|nr:hypothetical protein sync_2079 [Synechococcus sp. CC9311]